MARKLGTGSLLLIALVAALGIPASASAGLVGQKVTTSDNVLLGKATRRRARHRHRRHAHHRRTRVHAAGDCSAAHLIPRDENLAAIRDATLCLLNRQRARHHLRALRENRRLTEASEAHSRDMASRNFFDHTAPGGLTMVKRILRADYVDPHQGWMLGENIAWGTGELATPSGIVRMWMHSPGHRANILNRSFREIGIGVVVGVPVDAAPAAGGATYTTDFGRRS